MPRKPKRPTKSKSRSPKAAAKKPARAKPAKRAKSRTTKAPGHAGQLVQAVADMRERTTLRAVQVLQQALLAKMQVVRKELQRHLQALEAAQRTKAE